MPTDMDMDTPIDLITTTLVTTTTIEITPLMPADGAITDPTPY